jgi:hypothetical protein
LRDAYAHLLANGVEIQRGVDHVCHRSIYFTDPDGSGLEIYYEMRDALTLSRTAAAMRTSACRSLAPLSRYPPGSLKTGLTRPLSQRSNACADRHQSRRGRCRAEEKKRIPSNFASSLAGCAAQFRSERRTRGGCQTGAGPFPPRGLGSHRPRRGIRTDLNPAILQQHQRLRGDQSLCP